LPADCTLSYATAFGKIYVGERLKILFTLMNLSEQHQLNSVKLTIKMNFKEDPESKEASKSRVLLEDIVPTMV
jgi:hypothetical protein